MTKKILGFPLFIKMFLLKKWSNRQYLWWDRNHYTVSVQEFYGENFFLIDAQSDKKRITP
jgi:hypothetical protein